MEVDILTERQGGRFHASLLFFVRYETALGGTSSVPRAYYIVSLRSQTAKLAGCKSIPGVL